jgi:murein DD-endopeptidase MepM/ murein hydrolase activator NlpD
MYCHGNPINMVDPDGHAKVDSATRWRLSNVMDRTNYPDLQVDPGEGYKDNIEAKVQASVKSNSDNIAAEKKAIAEKQQHQQENSTRVIKRLMYGLSSNGGSFRYDESVRAITSDFGWRIHPTRGGESFHGGQDLIFGDGWVRAQMDGTASKVDRMGGYGQALIVDSGPIDGTPGSPRMTQLYGHFDEFMAPNGKIMPLIFVKPGDKVQRGDIIGIQGMTGTATGPHCHFEIRIGGVAVDPFVMPRADTMSTWGP